MKLELSKLQTLELNANLQSRKAGSRYPSRHQSEGRFATYPVPWAALLNLLSRGDLVHALTGLGRDKPEIKRGLVGILEMGLCYNQAEYARGSL